MTSDLSLPMLLVAMVTVWMDTAQCQHVTLTGAGATFPNQVYQQWIAQFKLEREAYVSLDLKYESTGSTEGKKRITGQTELAVDFAGSDSLLSPEDYAKKSDLKMFPTMAGAVVIAYNLPELITGDTHLVLSMHNIVAIYNGSLQYWDDPRIKEHNPSWNIPHQKIQLLARADKSGTTGIFTGALSSVSPLWNKTKGTFSAGLDENGLPIKWNHTVISYFGNKNAGITGLLMSFPYSLGYVSVADAVAAKLSFAHLINRDGRTVIANTSSVQASMEARAKHDASLTGSLTDYGSPWSYPIAGYTYMIVKSRTMTDCNKAVELLRYIAWMLSEDIASSICIDHSMAPVSSTVQALIQKSIIEEMKCLGDNVWDIAKARMAQEKKDTPSWLIPVVLIVVLSVCIMASIIGYGLYRYISFSRILNLNEWDIDIEEILFYHTATLESGEQMFVNWPSVTSLTDASDLDDGLHMVNQILQWPGKWNGQTVGLRLLEIKDLQKVTRDIRALLLNCKKNIFHNNILCFHGLSYIHGIHYVVSEYCSRGPLMEVLKDPKLQLNNDFKFSLSLDVASGLEFLHSKSVVHGNLKSICCLLDVKWTVKIADWEYTKLYTKLNKKKNPLLPMRKNPDIIGQNEAAFADFWTAPELLKDNLTLFPSYFSDVYSLGIIIQEIFTLLNPYAEHLDQLSHYEILKAVIQNNLRPKHGDHTPNDVKNIMDQVWDAEQFKRPTSEQIVKTLKASHRFKKGIIDSLMEKSEEYIQRLENKLSKTQNDLCVCRKHYHSLLGTLVPPGYQQKLMVVSSKELPHTVNGENQHQPTVEKIDACLVVITLTGESDVEHFTTQLQKVDSVTTHLSNEYKGFKCYLNACSMLVVFGKELQSGTAICKPVLDAACFALSLHSHLTRNQANTSSAESTESGVKIGIHRGTVTACMLVSTIPKSYFLGHVVDHAILLCDKTQVNRVLISKTFADSLKPMAEGRFSMKPFSDSNTKDVGTPCYWLWAQQTIRTPSPQTSKQCSSNL